MTGMFSGLGDNSTETTGLVDWPCVIMFKTRRNDPICPNHEHAKGRTMRTYETRDGQVMLFGQSCQGYS